jgi:hypothetical protein
MSDSVSDAFLNAVLRNSEVSGLFAGSRKATFLGATFSSFTGPSVVSFTDKSIDGIPTMVAPRELRLLANLFATLTMSGDVLEIGCYLGGSTNAIAGGLLAAKFSGHYYVLDSFSWNQPGFITNLRRDCERLAATYALSNQAWVEVSQGGWLQAFREVHQAKPYGHMLEIRRALIPYGGNATAFDLTQHVAAGTRLGAIFIDGFKSWPAATAAMTALQPYLQKGSLLIFQDFSWYDCYWLPILMTYLSRHARMLMKIDNTAVFQVTDPDISAGLNGFGTGPDATRYAFYRDILNNYAIAMFHSGDEVGFLEHTCQCYVLSNVMGRSEDAAEVKTFVKTLSERLRCGWVFDSLSKTSFVVHAGGDAANQVDVHKM